MLVFEHLDFTLVGHLRGLLEADGIPCEVRNEAASFMAGEVPFTQVFPELWIADDRDATRARAIIRDFREQMDAKTSNEDWTCAKCGEVVDGNFAECWNCGAPSPEG